jgi:hypothetical protein
VSFKVNVSPSPINDNDATDSACQLSNDEITWIAPTPGLTAVSQTSICIMTIVANVNTTLG